MKNIFSFLTTLVVFGFTCAIVGAAGFSPVESVGVSTFISAVTYIASTNIEASLSFVTCGAITRSNTKNCSDLPTGGTRDRLIIMNFEDVTFTFDNTNTNLITNIVLASGAVAYEIDGQNNSIVPMATMVERGFFDKFDQEVTAKGFDISPAAKDAFNSMVGGSYIAICENYHKGTNGNSAFEVYGATVGLELVELQREPNSEETEGAIHFRLYTRKRKENSLQKTFFTTDYTTTKAIVDGLLA